MTGEEGSSSEADPTKAVVLPVPEPQKPTQDKPAKPTQDKPAKPKKERPRAPVRLTKEQLQHRLRLNFPGLVEEIHTLAVRQNQAEDQRESRLDAKAQGLLGTAGLSLTVAFTFGSFLLDHPDYITPLGDVLSRIVIALYAVALVFGLLANIWAVKALKVSYKYKCLSDDDVFNEAELKRIEQEAEDDSMAKTWYRRFITIQHWRFWTQHFDIHQGKATTIKRGQVFFALFLGTLLLIGSAMAASSFIRYQNVPDRQADAKKGCPPCPPATKP